MKVTSLILIAGLFGACAAPSTETASDTTAIEQDTLVASGSSAAPTTLTPDNFSYEIVSGSSYISDPFDFMLSVEALKQYLGDSIEVEEQETPAGTDSEGESYGGYSHYSVKAGENTFAFYSYSGKHTADVVSPAIPFKNNVRIGISRSEFLQRMALPDSSGTAELFSIYDDYGSMYFYFDSDTLRRVTVTYEEGT